MKSSPEKVTNSGKYEFSLESYDNPEVSKILSASDITRKTPFNLPKLISYLIKNNATQSESNKSWIIRPKSIKKIKLDAFEWSTVFPGPEPVFEKKIPREIKTRKKEPLGEQNQKSKENIKKEKSQNVKKVKKESEEERKNREAADRIDRAKKLRKLQQELGYKLTMTTSGALVSFSTTSGALEQYLTVIRIGQSQNPTKLSTIFDHFFYHRQNR